MNRSCSLTWPTRALDSFVFWVSVLKTNKWCILSKWDHLAYPTEKKSKFNHILGHNLLAVLPLV